MYNRLLEIDDVGRNDHTYLTVSDRCFHLGEFTARAGFSHSETNNLINNLKKPVDRRSKPEWKHKERALKTVAEDLRAIIGQTGMTNVTFVPIPPSKVKTDPMYDDRINRILQMMAQGYNADIRELVVQLNSRSASHEGDQRFSPDELYENLKIDEALSAPPPSAILIVDDVLTTGAHYKAVQRKLIERFPEVHTYGLFVARRVLANNSDISFEVLDS